jgi:predicted membrane protein
MDVLQVARAMQAYKTWQVPRCIPSSSSTMASCNSLLLRLPEELLEAVLRLLPIGTLVTLAMVNSDLYRMSKASIYREMYWYNRTEAFAILASKTLGALSTTNLPFLRRLAIVNSCLRYPEARAPGFLQLHKMLPTIIGRATHLEALVYGATHWPQPLLTDAFWQALLSSKVRHLELYNLGSISEESVFLAEDGTVKELLLETLELIQPRNYSYCSTLLRASSRSIQRLKVVDCIHFACGDLPYSFPKLKHIITNGDTSLFFSICTDSSPQVSSLKAGFYAWAPDEETRFLTDLASADYVPVLTSLGLCIRAFCADNEAERFSTIRGLVARLENLTQLEIYYDANFAASQVNLEVWQSVLMSWGARLCQLTILAIPIAEWKDVHTSVFGTLCSSLHSLQALRLKAVEYDIECGIGPDDHDALRIALQAIPSLQYFALIGDLGREDFAQPLPDEEQHRGEVHSQASVYALCLKSLRIIFIGQYPIEISTLGAVMLAKERVGEYWDTFDDLFDVIDVHFQSRTC